MLLFYLCFMLEVRAVRCRDHYEPVKYVLAELASVDLEQNGNLKPCITVPLRSAMW